MEIRPRTAWSEWVRWPDLESGPWYAGFTWSVADGGRAELVGFELWSRSPGSTRADPGPVGEVWDAFGSDAAAPEVTATVLHAFPLRSVAKESRRRKLEAARRVEGTEDQLPDWAMGAISAKGRRRLGREHFVAVAELYKDSLAQGLDPLPAISERWQVTKVTATNWVKRARHEFGLLPPTTRGRAAAFPEVEMQRP